MAGSGGKLTKWLVNRTVVQPTKRKVDAAKTRLNGSKAVELARKAQGKTPQKTDDSPRCGICGKELARGRNVCSRTACVKAMAREWK